LSHMAHPTMIDLISRLSIRITGEQGGAVESTTYLLLGANGALLGICTGFIMHRSGFCLAGMFRDLFVIRQVTMLRFLFLTVVFSSVFFEAVRLSGLPVIYPSPIFSPPSVSNLVGGCLFGIGMVLAGGCVVGTLYKAGAGSLVSLAAFGGLIFGSAVYAEFHPFWMSWCRAMTFSSNTTIPQQLGIAPLPLVLALCGISWILCCKWHRSGRLRVDSPADGFLQPLSAALLLACVGIWSVIVTGMPLGVTTAYAKMGAYIESAIPGGHVTGLEYFTDITRQYVNPLTGVSLAWSAGPRFDAVAALQFPVIFGIAGGGALSALLLREFKFHYRAPVRQYVSAIVGGSLMGMASRMVPGCNVWHLCGGLPIFASQSLLFLAGLLPGAWLGSLLLVRIVIHDDGGASP
jgi:uncharacterized membrane protein YedE/YeeE